MRDHRSKIDDSCAMCHGPIKWGKDGGSFCSNPACHGRTWPSLDLNVEPAKRGRKPAEPAKAAEPAKKAAGPCEEPLPARRARRAAWGAVRRVGLPAPPPAGGQSPRAGRFLRRARAGRAATDSRN